MGLVAAKCTQCGANIEVDSSKEAGICKHCETAFITEKVINNYNTTNINYNTQNIVKNIYGREKTEAEDYIKNGDVFISLGNWTLAKEQFELAIKANPSNCFGWIGMLKTVTKNFENSSTYSYNILKGKYSINDTCVGLLENAKKVAAPNDLKEIEIIEKTIKAKENQLNRADDLPGYTRIDAYNGLMTLGKKILNYFPVCPFCGEKADWYIDGANDLYQCGNCFAKLKIKCNFTGSKIKEIKIVDVGDINLNSHAIGKCEINALTIAPKQ